MSESPNKLIRFWQELKRRKTGKVIIAYAATAFIILQLADILTPALSLPTWTTTLVTLLLALGFPLAVIFSWIFDITPEGIKKTESIEESENKETERKPARRRLRASNIIIAALIIVVGILAYPKIFKRNTLEKLRSSGERVSVAVMPFQNMTNDTIWNIWQDGIQDMLINSLSNSEELKVRQAKSINSLIESKGFINYASITPSLAGTISQKLDANVFLHGNIKQAGSTLRVYAQLIDSKTEEVYKSYQIETRSREETIFKVIDSLSVMVKNFLIMSELEKKLPSYYENYAFTSSPEALRYFIYGRNYFFNQDFPTAQNWLSKAISVDSNFIQAMATLSLAYGNEFLYEQATTSYANESLYDQAKKWCLKAYENRDQMPIQQKIDINRIYALYFETPNEEIKYLKQLLDFDDQNPVAYYSLGNSYFDLNQYDNAIPEYKKALELFKKWGLKPNWAFNYCQLGEAYHKLGNYKEEEKLYKKAEQDFPDDPNLLYRQVVLSLTVGDTVAANRYTEKGNSFLKSVSSSEATIAATMASGCAEAGLMEKAEEYYRKSLSLEPDSALRLNDLGYFLIEKDRNVNEGMELVDKALELRPGYYLYLHTMGWGLYKQGKYQEAKEILQRSWDLRRQNAIYDHEAFLHLEAAKKAVASQKNN